MKRLKAVEVIAHGMCVGYARRDYAKPDKLPSQVLAFCRPRQKGTANAVPFRIVFVLR
jgi:hypothetical protein